MNGSAVRPRHPARFAPGATISRGAVPCWVGRIAGEAPGQRVGGRPMAFQASHRSLTTLPPTAVQRRLFIDASGVMPVGRREPLG
jgi:hypothetical protein